MLFLPCITYVFGLKLLLTMFGLNGLRRVTGWRVFSYLQLAVMIAWPVYLYFKMKNFYAQGRGKTFSKFLLLNLAGFFVLLLLFVLFFVLSIFKM